VIELFLFLLVVGAVVAWWQLMQGRHRARSAAKQVCANHGLQLLDDTVSLASITWSRTDRNARILVNYGFEFATNGAVRRAGTASIGFPRGFTITLDLEQGRLIEKL
jgi:hypothetical protein